MSVCPVVGEGLARELLGVVRRVVADRVAHPQDREDLVQEALARTLGARQRLGATGLPDSSLPAYACTVARNVCAGHHARVELERRHAHRLLDPWERATSGDLGEQVVDAEDAAAVREALAGLDPQARDLLVDHVVGGRRLAGLAPATGPGSGGPGPSAGGRSGSGAAGGSAVAARLARSRAKARVGYLLAAAHRLRPPARCWSVLVAVSLADTRRLRALRAQEHLGECPDCGDLALELTRRRHDSQATAAVA